MNFFSYRMKYILLSQTDSQMCTTKQYIISRHRIIAAVDFHRRAIELVYLFKLKSLYTQINESLVFTIYIVYLLCVYIQI